jgi:two-component system sensor histidine kinase UhpB
MWQVSSFQSPINLRILISSVCILLLGGSIAIGQARDAVKKRWGQALRLTFLM